MRSESKAEPQKATPTHYEMLGVLPTAGPEAISAAYQKALTDWRSGKKTDAEYQEYKKAYDILGNTEKRLEYDSELLNKNKKPAPEIKVTTFEELEASRRAADEKARREHNERMSKIVAEIEENKRRKEQAATSKEEKTDEAKQVVSVEAKANDEKTPTPVAEKKAMQSVGPHKITRSGETFSYEAKFEENKLILQNTHCPSALPFPNEAIIAYLQDQIMQAQRVFGDKITIDLPENMDENLKKAYIMVCHANNVECTVNGVKQENKNEEKAQQEVKEKVLNEMEKRLEDLHRNLKEQKIPKDFSSQVAEIKQAVQTMRAEFASAKDFKGELYASSLLSMTNRLDTMAQAVEKKAEQEKLKAEAAVTQKAEPVAQRFTR